jgi:hypothetical protein
VECLEHRSLAESDSIVRERLPLDRRVRAAERRPRTDCDRVYRSGAGDAAPGRCPGAGSRSFAGTHTEPDAATDANTDAAIASAEPTTGSHTPARSRTEGS